jgi:hypothetical protein
LLTLLATDYRVRGDMPLLFGPISVDLDAQRLATAQGAAPRGLPGGVGTIMGGRRTLAGLRVQRVCFPNGRTLLQVSVTNVLAPAGGGRKWAVSLQFAAVTRVLADRYMPGMDRAPVPPPGAVAGFDPYGVAEPTRPRRRGR